MLGTFFNVATGETIVRELTPEEEAQYLETIKDTPALLGSDHDD
jgi:hypothetical protein